MRPVTCGIFAANFLVCGLVLGRWLSPAEASPYRRHLTAANMFTGALMGTRRACQNRTNWRTAELSRPRADSCRRLPEFRMLSIFIPSGFALKKVDPVDP